MREIKFRAWVSDTKIMVLWDDILGYRSRDECTLHDYLEERTPGAECHVMQFTGLKDKNGKEIYEGDIVSIFIGRFAGSRAEITFCEGAFCLRVDQELEHNTGLITFKDQCIYNLDYFTINDNVGDFLEVIGNIFQNHELLETKEQAKALFVKDKK